ncbi:TetR/AcrR family transcriptional regulator [Actinomycetospora cinnamomea]|uniref:TetR family transcriptional regulator n=1 Tax=Actinomycetospora cinnamomea TaxID=663609 RepID=A0A2U1FQ92_9PSEU|nr:TetR/AcrR family transcriptional regulator [Actinomycetospora cinnamomea]PVZ14363.1 TetR family transcriptional regulator [Actinomycetospora cinnamomea]
MTATRDAIEPPLLDAVSRILEREGLRGLNISAIAVEAGVSRVTLHRRGARLDDYLVAVLGRASDDLRGSLWPVLTGTGTARERLVAAMAVLCDVYERHAGIVRAMYGEPARPLPAAPGGTTSRQFVEPFERLLADGLTDGSLTCSDPREDALLLANTVAWTFLHMRLAHRWPRDQAVARVVDLATARFLPDRPGPG